MEIQYLSHIKDRESVTFMATTNPVPNICEKEFVLKKIVYFLILSLISNLYSCTKLISNKSLYDYISNMKEVSSYDKNKTIDDFDSVTLGLIEQYDDRQGEKQGIEWILL